MIPIGYVCAFGSLVLFPPGLGLAGVVVGIVNVTRGRAGHGVAQIALSVTCALLGAAIGFYVATH